MLYSTVNGTSSSKVDTVPSNSDFTSTARCAAASVGGTSQVPGCWDATISTLGYWAIYHIGSPTMRLLISWTRATIKRYSPRWLANPRNDLANAVG